MRAKHVATVVFCAACAPSVHVRVEPRAFDRDHRDAAWYVYVEEARASGDVWIHQGYVCGDRPAEFRVRVRCPEEAAFRGRVWRMPDASFCTRPPPAFLESEVARRGGKRVAELVPATVFRGDRRDRCGEPRSVNVELWPPVDEDAMRAQLWNEGWGAPEDAPYRLERAAVSPGPAARP